MKAGMILLLRAASAFRTVLLILQNLKQKFWIPIVNSEILLSQLNQAGRSVRSLIKGHGTIYASLKIALTSGKDNLKS